MEEETNQHTEDEIDQMEDNNNLQKTKQEDNNQHRDEDLKQESELQNPKKDIDGEAVEDVIDADSVNHGQIPLNVNEQESKLYQNDQITVKEEDNHTPNKAEQEVSSETDSLNHAGNETANESIETEKMSVNENVQTLSNVTELQKDEVKNLQEDKIVDEMEETAKIEDSNSDHENEETDEHDDVEKDGQSAVQSDPVKAEITNQFKTQSEEIQEEKTSAGSVSHTGEGLLQTFDDSLRPYTRQTLTDRPVSISSFVYSAKDFPTPDYEQYVRPTPSVAESDNDRPESKASRAMKSGTSRGDGTKSVTFADDVKSDEIGKQDSEGPQEDDSVTDKEELFSTAVSEEKIEEATKKLRSGSADSSGSENSLLKEVFGLQRVKLVSGSDLLNKRANEHYERGCQLHNTGNMFAAIIAFDKAINLCPSEVRFYLMRGEAYLQVTDFQSAIQSFKKACVLRPTSDIYYSKLAFVYYLQGQSLFDQCLFTEALESFSRAAEMRPEIIGYHTRSIACLAALERHGECLALVNKRLELERSNPDLYIMRARLHLLFRNTSLSYYDLKDALSLDPEQPEAQKILQDLEKRAQDNRDFAVRLQLQGKFKRSYAEDNSCHRDESLSG
ncbi:putative tetratricopeptide repeat protein 16 [Apostichopus japonicus]|uniref:Putative tetratricopeptide repeat protein 16 n=1 Tax=Stichopus japonicus TaxID=307972 RepID=A0A2G8K683_STIJA|nr:putative tetratricopeptide repeat protein 16 [Apostichopus japonicus]